MVFDSFVPGNNCIIYIVIASYFFAFFIYRDCSNKIFSSFVPSYSFITSFIIASYFSVKRILFGIGNPEIAKHIIAFNLIDMIKLFRPFPINIEPGKMVRFVYLSVYTYFSIWLRGVNPSCLIARLNITSKLIRLNPCKNPAIRAVVQNRFEVFLSNHFNPFIKGYQWGVAVCDKQIFGLKNLATGAL